MDVILFVGILALSLLLSLFAARGLLLLMFRCMANPMLYVMPHPAPGNRTRADEHDSVPVFPSAA